MRWKIVKTMSDRFQSVCCYKNNNINKNEKNKEAIHLFELLFKKKENYINEYV